MGGREFAPSLEELPVPHECSTAFPIVETLRPTFLLLGEPVFAFDFLELIPDAQGAILAQVGALGCALLSLTSKEALQLFGQHRRRTDNLLRLAAEEGESRLFESIRAEFAFPLYADVHGQLIKDCLEATVKGGHVEFFDWFSTQKEVALCFDRYDNKRRLAALAGKIGNVRMIMAIVTAARRQSPGVESSVERSALCGALTAANLPGVLSILEAGLLSPHEIGDSAVASAALSSCSFQVIAAFERALPSGDITNWATTLTFSPPDKALDPLEFHRAFCLSRGITPTTGAKAFKYALKHKRRDLFDDLLRTVAEQVKLADLLEYFQTEADAPLFDKLVHRDMDLYLMPKDLRPPRLSQAGLEWAYRNGSITSHLMTSEMALSRLTWLTQHGAIINQEILLGAAMREDSLQLLTELKAEADATFFGLAIVWSAHKVVAHSLLHNPPSQQVLHAACEFAFAQPLQPNDPYRFLRFCALHNLPLSPKIIPRIVQLTTRVSYTAIDLTAQTWRFVLDAHGRAPFDPALFHKAVEVVAPRWAVQGPIDILPLLKEAAGLQL